MKKEPVLRPQCGRDARRLAGLAIAVSVVTLLAAPAAAFSDDSFHRRIEKPGRRACVEPKAALPSGRTS